MADMTNPTQAFKDDVSRMAHGMTKQEALSKGICVDCKLPDALSRCYSDLGRKEYYISGMCERCWDALMSDASEEDFPLQGSNAICVALQETVQPAYTAFYEAAKVYSNAGRALPSEINNAWLTLEHATDYAQTLLDSGAI
jgi:hypothetical protein